MDREKLVLDSLFQLDSQLPYFYCSKFEEVVALGGFELLKEQVDKDQPTQSRFIKLINAIVVSGVPLEQAVALTCKVLRGLRWEGGELDTLERYAAQGFSLQTSYPQIQHSLNEMNCNKLMMKVCTALLVLEYQLLQFYIRVIHLAVCNFGQFYQVQEQSKLVQYFDILYRKLGHPSIAAAFICSILTRFGFKDIGDLQKYATPNYNLELTYPEVDLRLTVAEFFYSLDRKRECPNVIRIIAREHLNNYASDKITSIAGFVQLLWIRSLINVDDISIVQKIAELCQRPTFFNKYYKRQNLPLCKIIKFIICNILYLYNLHL